MKTVGLILIILGFIMTIFTGFTMVREKKVAQIGPVEINKNESTPVYWQPVVGVVILVSGIVVVAVSKKKA